MKDIIQEFEQIAATMINFAVVLKEYESALLKQGFTKTQAFLLVQDYQRITLGPNKK